MLRIIFKDIIYAILVTMLLQRSGSKIIANDRVESLPLNLNTLKFIQCDT